MITQNLYKKMMKTHTKPMKTQSKPMKTSTKMLLIAGSLFVVLLVVANILVKSWIVN